MSRVNGCHTCMGCQPWQAHCLHIAAQKRMERLQVGGLAQTNDSIAVASISSSRPGTPKTAKMVETFGSTPAGTPAAAMPVPPAAAPGPGGRSLRLRAGSSSSGGHAGDQGPAGPIAGPWQGSGPIRWEQPDYVGAACQQCQHIPGHPYWSGQACHCDSPGAWSDNVPPWQTAGSSTEIMHNGCHWSLLTGSLVFRQLSNTAGCIRRYQMNTEYVMA